MPQAGVPGKAGFPKKEEHLKHKRRTCYATDNEWWQMQELLAKLRAQEKEEKK